MARKKNKTEKAAPREISPAMAQARRAAIHCGIAIALICGAAFGLVRLKRYVERSTTAPSGSLIIVLKNKPAWMTDDTVRQIADAARPAGDHDVFDHGMLVGVRKRLETCAWVANVRQVRRAFTQLPGDTLEIDCAYRVPTALVHWGRYYWLVDRAGVKLPEQFLAGNVPRTVLGPDNRINLRLIDGVRNPPPEAGHLWTGRDLAAGLEMAGVLFERPYTEEIIKIDVSNIDGRQDPKEPQVTLMTRYGSRILWGRIPSAPDSFIESTPEKKLESLASVYATFGRVDAHQPWIDVRLDGVLGATPAPAIEGSGHARIDRDR